ncbi:MAG TPA: nucleotide exchange factor GrpE [Candidatus Paceibacterota bacterium]
MSENEEDFVVEEEGGGGPEALKKLREKLAVAVREKQNYLEGWQRERADFANYKKEQSAVESEREERMKAQFAETMTPALDAAWLAQKGEWFAQAPAGLQSGVKHIFAELQRSLESFGISLIVAIPPNEKIFFAKFEVIKEVPTDDESKDHTIEEVFRPGLAIGSYVIRPAQVSIFVFKS